MLFSYMKNWIIRKMVRVITGLIPVKKWRKNLRRAWLSEHSPVSFPIYNGTYKIYPPHYSTTQLCGGTEPEIFNKHGERVRTFFVRDRNLVMHCNMCSRYFQIERYNIGLETHLYGHASMLETMGKPKRRFGYLVETRGTVPEDYRLFDRHPGLNKDFDLIFTHEYDIIAKYDNARFWPSWAMSWIPAEFTTTELLDRKTKKASIVSSYKSTADLHNARTAAARYLKANHGRLGVDTFGTFDGGPHVPIHETLVDYRYSIAVENYVSPWLFTERLINCFATCTVPIYVGASDAGRFFNTDGIIQISPKDLLDIDRVVAQCSEADYESRRGAMLDNFERAKEYTNPWDYMYLHYLSEDRNEDMRERESS